MKIIEIYIESFGKLSKFRKSFTDGKNALLEENEFGKTTLSFFIKAMLYGFDDTRKVSLDENERKKYLPWQGGNYGGWLVFETKGKTYRVERSFGAKSSEDTFALYDIQTGLPSSDFTENLGEGLFGIDSDGFERTVFLSEKNLGGKNTNQTISAKLSDLVGVEGDIGGFDDAIKLLDERRKFYYKRGGSGEINDVQEDILRNEDKLESLRRKKVKSEEYERGILSIGEEIAAIKAKKEELTLLRGKIAKENEKRSYELQYNDMKKSLKSDEERRESLLSFFGNKVPEKHEISAYSDCFGEILQLERKLSEISEDKEICALEEKLGAVTSYDCERILSAVKKTEREKEALIQAEAKAAPIKSPFKRVPLAEEIEKASSKLTSPKKSNSALIYIIAAAFLIVLGAALGAALHPAFFAISALGAAFAAIGAVKIRKHKPEAFDADKFIKEIYGEFFLYDSPLSVLINMRAQLEKYNTELENLKRAKLECELLAESIEADEAQIREFLLKFPDIFANTAEEKISQILRYRQKCDLLRDEFKNKEAERITLTGKLSARKAEYEAFISRFKTEDENPLNEIRAKCAEYELLEASLTRQYERLDAFAKMHGIEGEAVSKDEKETANTPIDVNAALSETEDMLIAKEREKTRLESEYALIIEDIEAIDELEEKLRELNEKIEEYKDNLSTITKAKDLLTLAKSNMTARYLDGARTGFLKYVSEINRTCGEYNMDTSFVITKNDLGKSRHADSYSKGTKDMHALAVRLSLIDALYENELPPIILDDPFVSFDDVRIRRALAVLDTIAKDRQVIYFTCSKSRI